MKASAILGVMAVLSLAVQPVRSDRAAGLERYRTLFNHDGWCAYQHVSPYWDGEGPVPAEQILGYVDEVADAGIDVLLLCPNIYLMPGWDSDHSPFWRNEGRTMDFSELDSPGPRFARIRDFILSGNDIIALSAQRARERGIAFFITWRMNDVQFLERPTSPSASPFWREHPEYRVGGPGVPAGDGDTSKRPLLALDFRHEAVRDHKFGFLEELCRRYPLDGLELDFLRFPYFFPPEMPFEEKAPIMNEFVRRVRRMMDDKGLEIPLGVRIGGNFEVNRSAGLDIHTWVREGWVDMLNLSASMITVMDNEMERFRAEFPNVRLYGEITHLASHRRGPGIDAVRGGHAARWHIPREITHAAAHSFLDRGADGISFFNYVYTRNHRVEPDFDALRRITDTEYLSGREKHYHVHSDRSHMFRALFDRNAWSRQMPVVLEPDASVRIAVPVADAEPARDFRQAILRIYSSRHPLRGLPIEARFRRLPLEETEYPGPLSESPVPHVGAPATNANQRDYLVPLDRILRGWNFFEFHLVGGEDPVSIEDLELRLFREVPEPGGG